MAQWFPCSLVSPYQRDKHSLVVTHPKFSLVSLLPLCPFQELVGLLLVFEFVTYTLTKKYKVTGDREKEK